MTGPHNPRISRSESGTGFSNWGFLFLLFVIDFLKVLLIFFPGCSDRASLPSLAKSLWEVDLPQVYVIKCFSWMYLPLRLTWSQAQFNLFSYILYRALKLGRIQTLSRLCSLRPDFGRNADWLLEQCHQRSDWLSETPEVESDYSSVFDSPCPPECYYKAKRKLSQISC